MGTEIMANSDVSDDFDRIKNCLSDLRLLINNRRGFQGFRDKMKFLLKLNSKAKYGYLRSFRKFYLNTPISHIMPNRDLSIIVSALSKNVQ